MQLRRGEVSRVHVFCRGIGSSQAACEEVEGEVRAREDQEEAQRGQEADNEARPAKKTSWPSEKQGRKKVGGDARWEDNHRRKKTDDEIVEAIQENFPQGGMKREASGHSGPSRVGQSEVYNRIWRQPEMLEDAVQFSILNETIYGLLSGFSA